jgi:hypothetical protein
VCRPPHRRSAVKVATQTVGIRSAGGVKRSQVRYKSTHGSVFEYDRNGTFDAQQPFTASRPSFTQNEFGGVVGGPVVIPKLYNGKNKTFFFGAYQGFRYSLTQAKLIKVPTAAELAGDESSWPTQIYNPFSDRTQPSSSTLDPYRGTRLPRSQHGSPMKFIPCRGPVLMQGQCD